MTFYECSSNRSNLSDTYKTNVSLNPFGIIYHLLRLFKSSLFTGWYTSCRSHTDCKLVSKARARLFIHNSNLWLLSWIRRRKLFNRGSLWITYFRWMAVSLFRKWWVFYFCTLFFNSIWFMYVKLEFYNQLFTNFLMCLSCTVCLKSLGTNKRCRFLQ